MSSIFDNVHLKSEFAGKLKHQDFPLTARHGALKSYHGVIDLDDDSDGEVNLGLFGDSPPSVIGDHDSADSSAIPDKASPDGAYDSDDVVYELEDSEEHFFPKHLTMNVHAMMTRRVCTKVYIEHTHKDT